MNVLIQFTKASFLWMFFLCIHSTVLFASEPIKTSDVLKIQQINQVQISPDGTKALYVVRSVVSKDDDYGYENQIWLVHVDGNQPPRQLTFSSDGASQPNWHPEGNRFAFVRNVDGKAQVFVMSLQGGEAQPYTEIENGASSPHWSPDGRHLLYSVTYSHKDILKMDAFNDGPAWSHEKPVVNPYKNMEGVEADPDGSLEQIRVWLKENEDKQNPKVLNRINFQGEFNLIPQRSYTHWYVMPDAPKADGRALTSGFFSFGGANWAPNSQVVYLTGNMQVDIHPDRERESAIYKVSIAGGQPERFIYNAGFSFSSPVSSPNGQFIAFRWFDLSERGYNQAEIGILDTRSGQITHYGSAVDRSFGSMKWSPDSRFIYAVAPTNGGFPLYRLRLSTGNFERLSPLETGIRAFDVHSNTVVYVETRIENPFEVYVADASMNRGRRVSSHNHQWLVNRTLVKPEMHTVTTDDGFEVQYWVMKPHEFTEGQKYPTVLQIHGGPSAMWGPGEVSMWHEFQLFAAHGIGVVYSNPRGSGGYGYDFQKGNHQDWGFGPMKDVLTALEVAAQQYDWIDEEKLTTTGGSYGGYLVGFILGNDQRFVAAAAQRGVYELETFLGEGNAWGLVDDRFGGYPWEDGMRALLERESPQTYAHLIETPLLILHADTDLRTGVSQSEMMYRTLKILERDVEYIRYPNAGHDLSRTGNPNQRMDRLLRMIEFMKRYI